MALFYDQDADKKTIIRNLSVDRNSRGQYLQSLLIVLAAMVPPTIILLWVLAQDNPAGYYLRDALLVARTVPDCCAPDIGLVSNLGIVVWSVAAGVAFFVAVLLFGIRQQPGHVVKFFATTGALTIILAVDDLFLLHEEVLVGIGISEMATLIAYGAAALGYFFIFRLQIYKSYFLVALAAAVFFAASLFLDRVFPIAPWAGFFEDSAKFIGIWLWAAFIFSAGISAVRNNLEISSD